MRFMLKIFIALMFTALAGYAQETVETTHFGEMSLTIGNKAAQTYYAHNALLYNNVDLEYDKTLNLQTQTGTTFYYFPQLRKGERNVLHLLLSADQDARIASKEYLDVYFVFDDSLQSSITLGNTDSTAFIFRNGKLAEKQVYASNHTGTFNLSRTDSKSGVTGNINTNFTYAFDGESEVPISLKGDLSIPSMNLLSGQETGITARKGILNEENRKRNILFAGLIIIAVLAGFAFR